MQGNGYNGQFGPYHQSAAWLQERRNAAETSRQENTPHSSVPPSQLNGYHLSNQPSVSQAVNQPSNPYDYQRYGGPSVPEGQLAQRITSPSNKTRSPFSTPLYETFSHTLSQTRQQRHPSSPYQSSDRSHSPNLHVNEDRRNSAGQRGASEARPIHNLINNYNEGLAPSVAHLSQMTYHAPQQNGPHPQYQDHQYQNQSNPRHIWPSSERGSPLTQNTATFPSIPMNDTVSATQHLKAANQALGDITGPTIRTATLNAIPKPSTTPQPSYQMPPQSKPALQNGQPSKSPRVDVPHVGQPIQTCEGTSNQRPPSTAPQPGVPQMNQSARRSEDRQFVKAINMQSAHGHDTNSQAHAEYRLQRTGEFAEVPSLSEAINRTQSESSVSDSVSIGQIPTAPPVASAGQGHGRAGSQDAASESTIRDQMEMEMKQMIEKMRDYKSKDPSLFVQIWDQVKKGLPPQMAPSKAATADSPATPNPPDKAFISPASTGNRASSPSTVNLYTEFPPDFDRGRFPAQRRRRGGMHGGTPKRLSAMQGTMKVSESQQPSNSAPRSSLQAPTAQMTIESNRPVTDQNMPLPHPLNDVEVINTLSKPASAAVASTQGDSISSQSGPKRGALPTSTQFIQPGRSSTEKTPSHPTPGEAASRPPKITPGATRWPEDKKRALAEAASTMLTAANPMLSMLITADEIAKLLQTNPSYTQLCAHFKAQGCEFDSGALARFLLSKVPDLHTSNPRRPDPAPMSPPTWTTRPTQSDRPSQALERLPFKATGHTAYPTPNGTGPQVSQPDSLRAYVSGKLSEPATKEIKARKRTFSDIVDLTELDDDEGDQFRQPSKEVRMDQSMLHENAPSHIANTKRQKLLKTKVVERIDRRKDAARRSSYDPRTIVRDVLITTGKHPYLAPLNAHLNILRDRFESVNDESDLSTFRWDLVDPEERSLHNADENGADQAKRSHADTMSQLKSMKERYQYLPPGSGAPEKGAMSFVEKGIQSMPTTTPMKAVVIGEPERPSSPVPDMARSVGVTPTPNHSSAKEGNLAFISTLTPGVSERVPGRKGRPPGAKNRSPRSDKGIPKGTVKNGLKREVSSGPTPPSQKASTPTRPSGLRNVSTPNSYGRIAIVVPSRSPSILGNESEEPVVNYKNKARSGHHEAHPTARSFKCRWSQCPAELHDIATLQKHVDKHRSRSTYPVSCEWSGCGTDGDGVAITNDEEWGKHMEGHLKAIEQGIL